MNDRHRRSGELARYTLVVALGAASTLCVGLAFRSENAPAQQSRARVATPLWSARRVPQAFVDAVGAQRLGVQLTAALTGTDACVIVADRDRPVVSRSPDLGLAPASTQKLLTAAAVLHLLGPDFRYETTLVATTQPADGSVDRLWLVGAGDPVISTPDRIARLAKSPLTKTDVTTPLAELADALVKQGVRSVPGGIWGDDSRYDSARTLPSWPASYRSEVGPLSALTVDDGYDRTTGAPAADPARYTAAELTRLLVARGVTVGAPGHATAPGNTTTIATLTSPPLRDVLASALRSSDNLTMELVTRELGVHASRQGTTAAGTQAVSATLSSLGLPTTGLVLVDGSGLDHGNRTTCALLLATVQRSKDPELHALADGLPVAGETGTLATRLVRTPLQGKLRAKTGSLQGATALVGFVDVSRPLALAFVADGGFSEVTGITLRERVATIIGRYPDAPAPDVLVPAPAQSVR